MKVVCRYLLLLSALFSSVSFALGQKSTPLSEQYAQLQQVHQSVRMEVLRDYELSMLPKIKVVREQAKALNDKAILVDTFLLEGAILQQFGAYKDALVARVQALSLAEKLDDVSILIQVYFAFVELELELERLETAQRYLSQIKQLLQQSRLDGIYSIRHTHLTAQVLQKKGSTREAIALLDALLKQNLVMLQVNNEVKLTLANAYLEIGLFEQARRILFSIEEPQQHLFAKEQIQFYVAMARCHLQAGEFYQAQLLAYEQLQQTFDTRYLDEQGQLQQILASAFVQQRDYKQAHLYLKRALMTERAINLQKRSNKVLQLEAQFSLAHQKQQVTSLTKDNAEQAMQLERQQQLLENARLAQQRWVLLALLVFGIGGFLYWRWQNKRYLVVLKEQVHARTAELAERNERLQALSFTDSLTGLRNRHYFFSVIDSLVNKPDLKESVFCIVDIDHFKRINDTYGHSAGDLILQHFAEILKQCTRRSDIVVRWGGEEFLLLMPDMTREDACEVVERIRLQVNRFPFMINDHILTCTCSIGFAPLPLVPEKATWLNWEQTLELADIGLYIAKETRRNAWMGIAQLLNPEQHDNAQMLSKEARTLIRKGDIRVFTSHSQVMLNI
ncbi:putative transcription regulator (with tandem N-terminal response regulator domains) protein [Pseudoalteromonas luteoviolacea B = ATCC 29581]|nr:putative transcription regulator (with tandem N-terminal response regulator domains) protein [Pseudoalteromonas luteoviolacea B = ATCC 29581]